MGAAAETVFSGGRIIRRERTGGALREQRLRVLFARFRKGQIGTSEQQKDDRDKANDEPPMSSFLLNFYSHARRCQHSNARQMVFKQGSAATIPWLEEAQPVHCFPRTV